MSTNGFFMYIPEFIDYLLLEKAYSRHTVTAYKKDVLSFKDFYESENGTVSLLGVNYPQIRSWIVSLVNNGVSNRTVNRKVAALKSYFKFLIKIEKLDKNPLVKHKALKVSRKLQIPFSPQEVLEVINGFTDDSDFESVRDRLIIELFYATGIRRIELVDLKIQDVDIANKVIKVLGKRSKERYVPLLASVVETATKYLTLRSHLPVNQEVSNFFLTKNGVKVYEMLVYRVINNYFSKVSSKVKKSPHVLRHSFATHLLNEGANLNSVKELLGHSSLAATQIYTHQSVAQLAKVYKQSHPRNKREE